MNWSSGSGLARGRGGESSLSEIPSERGHRVTPQSCGVGLQRRRVGRKGNLWTEFLRLRGDPRSCQDSGSAFHPGVRAGEAAWDTGSSKLRLWVHEHQRKQEGGGRSRRPGGSQIMKIHEMGLNSYRMKMKSFNGKTCLFSGIKMFLKFSTRTCDQLCLGPSVRV